MATTKIFRILFATVTLVVSGCSSLAHKSTDDFYAQQLVGTWSSEYTDDRGNINSYGEKTYYADGTAMGFIVFPGASDTDTCSTLRKLTFQSRWKVQDGVLEISAAEYEPASLNDKKDEVIRDRIVSIDSNEARFEDLSDNSRFIRKRVR